MSISLNNTIIKRTKETTPHTPHASVSIDIPIIHPAIIVPRFLVWNSLCITELPFRTIITQTPKAAPPTEPVMNRDI
jgi:hypothetical protein